MPISPLPSSFWSHISLLQDSQWDQGREGEGDFFLPHEFLLHHRCGIAQSQIIFWTKGPFCFTSLESVIQIFLITSEIGLSPAELLSPQLWSESAQSSSRIPFLPLSLSRGKQRGLQGTGGFRGPAGPDWLDQRRSGPLTFLEQPLPQPLPFTSESENL